MFEIYKRGQGAVARWITAAALGALALFGCWELQDRVSAWTEEARVLGLSVSAVVSAAALVVFAVVIALLVNHRRFVDYLIASETELRKVAWPTREELKRQTLVVIVTLLLISLVLFIADLIFLYGSQKVYGM